MQPDEAKVEPLTGIERAIIDHLRNGHASPQRLLIDLDYQSHDIQRAVGILLISDIICNCDDFHLTVQSDDHIALLIDRRSNPDKYSELLRCKTVRVGLTQYDAFMWTFNDPKRKASTTLFSSYDESAHIELHSIEHDGVNLGRLLESMQDFYRPVTEQSRTKRWWAMQGHNTHTFGEPLPVRVERDGKFWKLLEITDVEIRECSL